MQPDRQHRYGFSEADELLRSFTDSLSDYALIVLDPIGIVMSWNAGAELIKGYKAEEIIGRHFSCFYLDTDVANGKPACDLDIAARTGRLAEIGEHVRKDGTHFSADVVIQGIRGSSGELLGYGQITRDVTARTERTEKEGRRHSMAQPVGSETKFKNLVDTMLDTIADGVVTINQRGDIQLYNKACARLFGYSTEEVLHKNVRMLMPEPYRNVHQTFIDNYRKTGIAKIIGIGREVMGQRKDGSTFPIDLAVGATRDGGEHAFVGIIRDLTERREADVAQDQLRQAQKMEALGQLTGGIAHDFNNLLAIIIGNLDLLAESSKDDEKLHEFLDPSINAALRGSELTQRLLAFGRKQALQPKIVSVNDLLVRFLTFARRTLDERVDISVVTDADLWLVRADPGQLEDALLNLSVNARDAMQAGGKIIFETKNVVLDEFYAADNPDVLPGDYAMIAVSDTGKGMPPEVLARACEPFFTTKETGKGSGLGLSMVYGFVKQSAGHLKIYSDPGSGTSIRIYLPRVKGATIPITEEAVPQAAERAQSAKLVLIVEDNPNVLRLTAAMVESLGYSVLTSTTGHEALEIIAQRRNIDLLLTDVMLAGAINGPVLAQRAVAFRPQLKVLFNTGYAEQAIFERGLLRKGVHLIGKPFRKQQLAQKILEVLDA